VGKLFEVIAILLHMLERWEREQRRKELKQNYDQIGKDVIDFTDRELGGRVHYYKSAAEAYEARAAARKSRD
jgi:hypothetical protein